MAVGFNNIWENKKIQNETFKLEAELIGFEITALGRVWDNTK
jgi:hypothetical protein